MKVLVCLFALFAVFLTVKCEPDPVHSRSKRGFAYAGGWPFAPYRSFSSPFAGAGAFAGAGFPFGGMAWSPFQWSQPAFTFPTFTWPQNWYEGPNVCKQVKVVNSGVPDELKDFMSPQEISGMDTSFNHESESCWGNQDKYICMKRIVGDNNESKTQATKYECCHGFVRNPNGPGCIESKGTDSSKKDKDYYSFVPKSKHYSSSSSTQYSASSSSDSGDSNVGAVAAQ